VKLFQSGDVRYERRGRNEIMAYLQFKITNGSLSTVLWANVVLYKLHSVKVDAPRAQISKERNLSNQ